MQPLCFRVDHPADTARANSDNTKLCTCRSTPGAAPPTARWEGSTPEVSTAQRSTQSHTRNH